MESVFPLVRHLSGYLTPVLLRLPVTANQITSASLAAGVAACICIAEPGWAWQVAGGFLLVLSYVLDNCDGEVARTKHQMSEFGAKFDTFVDWFVNSAIFVALGIGAERASGQALWFWLGVVGAAGGTINYLMSLFYDSRDRALTVADRVEEAAPVRHVPKWRRTLVHVFRELFRADFCFIVLILALFDLAWILLPAAAVGAQVYWLMQFSRAARGQHV